MSGATRVRLRPSASCSAPWPRGDQCWLTSWFGIRGIGSIYYLMQALNHGVAESEAQRLLEFTVALVAISVVLHGISVTPLQGLYARRKVRDSRSAKG